MWKEMQTSLARKDLKESPTVSCQRESQMS